MDIIALLVEILMPFSMMYQKYEQFEDNEFLLYVILDIITITPSILLLDVPNLSVLILTIVVRYVVSLIHFRRSES